MTWLSNLKLVIKSTVWLSYAGMGALLVHLGIDPQTLCLVIALMAFDTVVWMAKAIRIWKFQTKKMIWWLISKVFIIGIILFVWASLKIFSWEITEFVNTSITFIMWVLWFWELVSIIQNVIVVRTWKDMEERDAVWMVLSYLYNKMRRIIQSIADDN